MELSILWSSIAILISYISIYLGQFLFKWSGDELHYKMNLPFIYAKSFRPISLFVFLCFSAICFSLQFYIAPAIIFCTYLIYRTSYVYNFMYFISGLAIMLSPWFEFVVSMTCIFSLITGAVIASEKKKLFANSYGIFIGIILGFLIKIIFKI
jgi:hypothetical protein